MSSNTSYFSPSPQDFLKVKKKNQAGVVCPLYSSVHPPIYTTCVTWDNLLTFMPQGQRFTSCFFCGSELLSHVPRIKGNTCRHSLTSPSVTVRTLWETITSRYSLAVIMSSASESVRAHVCDHIKILLRGHNCARYRCVRKKRGRK